MFQEPQPQSPQQPVQDPTALFDVVPKEIPYSGSGFKAASDMLLNEQAIEQASFNAALRSFQETGKNSPELVAFRRSQRLAGLPEPTDAQEMQRYTEMQRVNLASMQKNSPVLFERLKDYENAELLRRDTAAWSMSERIAGTTKRGVVEDEYGKLAFKRNYFKLSEDDEKRYQELKRELQILPQSNGNWLAATGKMLGQMYGMGPENAAWAILGAGVGALAGPGGAGAGFYWGLTAGTAKQTFMTEAGTVVQDMIDQGYDPEAAKTTGLFHGALSSAMSAVGFGATTASLRSAVRGIFTPTLLSKLGIDPAKKMLFGNFTTGAAFKRYAGGVIAEDMEEIGQELSAIMAERIAGAISRDEYQSAIQTAQGTQDISERIMAVAVETFQGMALLGLPGLAADVSANNSRLAQAESRAKALTETINIVRGTDAAIHAPDAFADQIAEIAERQGAEEVILSRKQFDEAVTETENRMRQQNPGINPGDGLLAIRNRFPDLAKQLDEAEKSGADLRLKVADVALMARGEFGLHTEILKRGRIVGEGMDGDTGISWEEAAKQRMVVEQLRTQAVSIEARRGKKHQDEYERVRSDIDRKLQVVPQYTSQQRRFLSQVTADYYAVRAERMSREGATVTISQAYKQDEFTVVGPGTKEQQVKFADTPAPVVDSPAPTVQAQPTETAPAAEGEAQPAEEAAPQVEEQAQPEELVAPESLKFQQDSQLQSVTKQLFEQESAASKTPLSTAAAKRLEGLQGRQEELSKLETTLKAESERVRGLTREAYLQELENDLDKAKTLLEGMDPKSDEYKNLSAWAKYTNSYLLQENNKQTQTAPTTAPATSPTATPAPQPKSKLTQAEQEAFIKSKLQAMTQDEYANYLSENGLPAGIDWYTALTLANKFRGTPKSEIAAEYFKQAAQAKKYSAMMDVVLNKYLAPNLATSGAIAANVVGYITDSGRGWTPFKVNNHRHQTGDKHYKSYATIKDYLSVTADEIEGFLKALADSGFNGQIKFQDSGYGALSRFDHMVMHGATEADAKLGESVAKTYWADRLSATKLGMDEGGKSHTQLLAAKAEAAFANKQPLFPDISNKQKVDLDPQAQLQTAPQPAPQAQPEVAPEVAPEQAADPVIPTVEQIAEEVLQAAEEEAQKAQEQQQDQPQPQPQEQEVAPLEPVDEVSNDPFAGDARVQAVRELASLQKEKPRPLNKMFGPNPSTEQKAQHASLMREWEKKRRQVNKRIKEAEAAQQKPAAPAPKMEQAVLPFVGKEQFTELQQAAQNLAAGKITRDEWDATVARLKPVKEFASVPELTSIDDIKKVGKLKQQKINKPETIKDGQRIALRLDIPSWRDYKTWVVAVHEATKSGSANVRGPIAYTNAVAINNVTFSSREELSFRIAQGIENKDWAAVANGDKQPMTAEEVQAMAKEAINSPEWVQVGFNPEIHSYFWDRKTGEPIDKAEMVLQVGPLVLAKNPVYGKKSEKRFSRATGSADVAFKSQQDVNSEALGKLLSQGGLAPTIFDVLVLIASERDATNPTGSRYADLAKSLLGSAGIREYLLQRVYGRLHENYTHIKGARGVYHQNQNLSKDPKFAGGVYIAKEHVSNKQTVMHEIIHALTVINAGYSIVSRDTGSRDFQGDRTSEYNYVKNRLENGSLNDKQAAIAKIYMKAVEELAPQLMADGVVSFDSFKGGIYGLANINEFIAESFVNSTFQQKLASIKVEQTSTLWDKFVSAVRTVLGLNRTDETLLDAAIRAGAEFIGMTPEGYKTELQVYTERSKVIDSANAAYLKAVAKNDMVSAAKAIERFNKPILEYLSRYYESSSSAREVLKKYTDRVWPMRNSERVADASTKRGWTNSMPPQAVARDEQGNVIPLTKLFAEFLPKPPERTDVYQQAQQPDVLRSRATSEPSVAGTVDLSTLEITLTKDATFSTFLHEMSHIWLAVLFRDAQSANAPKQIVDDANTLLKWFGLNSFAEWEALPREDRADLHERWAYNFEGFISGEEAPSRELSGIFRMFRRWLTSAWTNIRTRLNLAYREELKQLGKPVQDLPILTTEVAEVMGRLLATDEQIAYNQDFQGLMSLHMTKDQWLALGNTEAEWMEILRLQNNMANDLTDELTEQTIRGMEWLSSKNVRMLKEHKAKIDAQRKKLEKQFMPELIKKRVHQARKLIQAGELLNPDGSVKLTMSESRLNLKMVRELFANDPALQARVEAELGTGKTGMLFSKGVDPSQLADVLGYPDAKSMVMEILNAPSLEEDMTTLVDAEMKSKYKDMMDPKKIQKQISAQLAGKMRQKMVAIELRGLDRNLRSESDAGQPQLIAQMEQAQTQLETLLKDEKSIRDERDALKKTEMDIRKEITKEKRKANPDQDKIAALSTSLEATKNANMGRITEINSSLKDLNKQIRKAERLAEGPRTTVATILRAAQEVAIELMGKTLVKDALPSIYETNARMRRRGTTTALARGESLVAIEQKRGELTQAAMAEQATAFQQEMDSFKEFVQGMFRMSRQDMAKGRDYNMAVAARGVAAAFGFGTEKQAETVVEAVKAMRVYAPELAADVEKLLSEANQQATKISQQAQARGAAAGRSKRNRVGPLYRELTVEQMQQLMDRVKGLWRRASEEKQVELGGVQRTVDEAANLLRAKVMERMGGKPVGAANSASGIMSYLALATRAEHLMEHLDGQQVGEWQLMVYRWVKDNAVKARGEFAQKLKQLSSILADIDMRHGEKIVATELGGHVFGEDPDNPLISELMHVILHMGNPENLEKMVMGKTRRDNPQAYWGKIDEEGNLDTTDLRKFIERMIQEKVLTEQHFRAAEKIFALMDELTPGALKAYYRVNGYNMKLVKHGQIVNSLGTFRGGYVPAQVDKDATPIGDIMDLKAQMNENFSNGMPKARDDFTKERVKKGGLPRVLNVNSLPMHIRDVLFYTHLQPVMHDLSKVLTQEDLANALKAYDPAIMRNVLIPWMGRTVRQLTQTPTNNPLDKIARKIRRNVGLDKLALSFNVMFQQFTGLSVSATRVPKRQLAKALAIWTKNPRAAREFIAGLSPAMAERFDNQMTEMMNKLEEVIQSPNAYKNFRKWAMENGMVLQAGAQNIVDSITWIGAFNEFMETKGRGLSIDEAQKQAASNADSIVRLTQGGGFAEDLSTSEAGTVWAQLFTQFQTVFIVMMNAAGWKARTLIQDMGMMRASPRVLSLAFFGLYVPLALGNLISEAMRGELGDDEDMDGVSETWFRTLVMAPLTGTASGLPQVGYLINFGLNSLDNKRYNDKMGSTPVFGAFEAARRGMGGAYDIITDPSRELRGQDIKDWATLIATITGIPVSVLAKPASYYLDESRGFYNPDNLGGYIRGMATGTGIPTNR